METRETMRDRQETAGTDWEIGFVWQICLFRKTIKVGA
jgi:hypothetical protein